MKTTNRSLLLVLILTFALSFVNIAGEKNPVSGELGKKLDTYLTSITPFGFSGALLVAKKGEIVINKGYGLAIRDKNIPNTSETIFCVGSITKQFTAAAIMTLEMKKKLNTSDPIRKYFKGVPKDKWKITLHNLLTHTSGLVPDVGGDYEKYERDETISKILALPLAFQPGERFEYSNVNYTLLAAIIEKVSGMPYEKYLYEKLFKPAGMEWTGYRFPKWDQRTVAHWYVDENDNDNSLSRLFPYWNLIGNGGILSTTDDMYKWHVALIGNKILSRDAKKKLFKPFLNDYAYGWDVLQREIGTLIQHNGGSELGNNAEIRRYIDSNIVTILLCNQHYNGRPLVDAVRGKIEDIVFGKDVIYPPEIMMSNTVDLKKFEGIYQLESGGLFNITNYGNAIRVKPSSQDAITSLVVPDGGDVTQANELNAMAENIMEVAIKGDFEPLYDVMENKEKRMAPVRDLIEGRIKNEKERIGSVKKVEALYTLPSARMENALETTIALRCEHGSIFFRLFWRDRKNIGVGPLGDAPPISFDFLPSSATEFIGYDIAIGRIMKINFTLDQKGSIVKIVVVSNTKSIEANRIEQ